MSKVDKSDVNNHLYLSRITYEIENTKTSVPVILIQS
jgi:hypothetical protein